MRIFREAIKWFVYITTGNLIAVTVNFAFSGEKIMPAKTLWEILLSAFLTTIVTVFLHPADETKPSITYLKMILHYLALCGVMTICGNWFGWIELNLAGILLMAISVAVVYLLCFLTDLILDRRQAEAINKRLKERYSDEE